MENSTALASFWSMQVQILTTENDNSPKNKAFDFVLQGDLSREVIETLSCLTEGSDFIDDQNYTQMRRIVLGLTLMGLEEEIVLHPENVDAV